MRHQIDGDWCLAGYAALCPEPEGITRRIHPEDEHLQYGPISTALREFADNLRIEDKTITELPIFMLSQVVTWYNLARNTFDNKTHRAIFLLLLAEALADEGM